MRHIWNAKCTARISCFIFVDWRDSGWLESAKTRIDTLAAIDHFVNYECDGQNRLVPFVMLFDRKNAPQKARDFQRWCNRREVFRSTTFEEYKPRKEADE